MKVKFNEVEYELVTRDLQDARLKLTIMKGESTATEIEADINASEAITVLTDDDHKIAEYTGFTDVIVVRSYEKAVTLELINNALLVETMALAGRVATLEDDVVDVRENASALADRTANLEQGEADLNQSQADQDDIIAEMLEAE